MQQQRATATCNVQQQLATGSCTRQQLTTDKWRMSLLKFSRDNEIIYLSSLLSLLLSVFLSLSHSLGARSILSFSFCEWLAISIKQRAQQRRLAVWHSSSSRRRCRPKATGGGTVVTRLYSPAAPVPDSADKSNGCEKCRQLMPQFISSATLLLRCGSGDKWAQRPQSNN